MKDIVTYINESTKSIGNVSETIFIQDSGAMQFTIGNDQGKNKIEKLIANFSPNAKLFAIGNYHKIKMLKGIDDLSCDGPHPSDKIIKQIDGLVNQLKPSKCVFIADESLFEDASEIIKNIAKSQQVELYVIYDGNKNIMKRVQDIFSDVNNITIQGF